MFRFQYTQFVWIFMAIAVMALLFLLVIQWKKRVVKRIGDPDLVKQQMPDYSPLRFTIKFILLCLAFALGVLAVMNLRRPGGAETISRKGIDIAIALDMSNSMLATDLAPSRLERARQFIRTLLEELPDDRVALVIFAGKAYLQMPLTIDHGAAMLYVSSAGPHTLPQQGTVLHDALQVSAGAFNPEEKQYKAIVLISDGEDHDDKAAGLAADLAERGIMINCIGIGSPAGAPIKDPSTGELKKDETGNIVMSRLNEEGLKQIASATNGVYTRLQGSEEAVKLLKNHLSQIEKKAFGDLSQMSFTLYFMWFAAGMFLLLVLESLIPERKKIKT